MAAVVDRFEFKRLVLKATPRVGDEEESKENSFWRKFKVLAPLSHPKCASLRNACILCVCVHVTDAVVRSFQPLPRRLGRSLAYISPRQSPTTLL